jgi:hypothetical protein
LAEQREGCIMEVLVFLLVLIAQAIPTVVAVVVGIAIARWLGLFQPRDEGSRVPTRRWGLILGLAVVAIVLVFALLFLGVSTGSTDSGVSKPVMRP